MIKKIIKGIILTLFVLIAILFAAPFLFKGKIIELVKKEVNKNINAKVDFKDVDISFFRHFPKVAVGLEELQVTGIGSFAADTLIAARRIDAAVNIMSIIKGKDMTIYTVIIESPRIHAIVNKEGLANWDIMKATTTTEAPGEEKPFKMQLQNYAIHNGYISYRDDSSHISSEIIDLNHEGSGDFSSDLFTLKTTTKAEAVSFVYGNIPFLANAKTSIDADIQVNNKENVYSFNTDKITVNDLVIGGKGVIKNLNDKGYDMDIQFKSASADFKNILSLIPSIYKNDFSKIKTTGTAVFSGFVKGLYDDTHIPGYHIDLAVKDGFFQYPDLPKPVKNINIKALVDNPDGQPDNNVINIEQGHIEMDNDPFDFRLLVKKPVSNMYIDAGAKGRLDLAKISQLIKLEKDTKMSGLLNADVYVKGNVTDIEQQQYDKFTAGGTIDLNNFSYVSKDYPTGVRINNLLASLTPAKVNISNISGQYLSSNFNGNGQINNLLNYVLKDKPLNAALNINADKVNLDDWMGTTSDTLATGSAAEPFIVPANLDVALNTKIEKLHYDKIDIDNLSGGLKIRDETVAINDVKGNALEGTIAINGSYSTKESKTNPAIALTYDVSKVNVQKTFYAFNTVQKIMPIGKFLAGKMTSQMSVTGKIGESMMPDVNTLTGKGNLYLIEGFLSKFAPLEKIASVLNVKELEQISLKDVKTSFEFTNGKMMVKPFNVKVSDINMEIGGLQGFDQSLDYIINMKIPRSLMGQQGNQYINDMVSQANSKGLPVKVGEIVNLKVNLGGFIQKPSVKVDFKQAGETLVDQLKEQVTDFVKSKFDSVKQATTNAIKDTVASMKKQAAELAKDELLKQMSGNKGADTSKPKPKLEESAKGMIDNFLKKKPKDTTGNKK